MCFMLLHIFHSKKQMDLVLGNFEKAKKLQAKNCALYLQI
jgi:hypothetical protein